ncbi:SMI1/KNR4 family protein [Streptomyces sp. NA04227]|uniref:SMI1/KNR4 family protein n=1 Tax=Streptomyces sp. NA04227 TaxID=2742136 RepID=UPI00159188B6|nr:SMI1/KNR4 family protein [Streptomyces sp. NA04227]QKW07955.1 SMI1/KNR4 family protein [Streptomyces sp. NA04227]
MDREQWTSLLDRWSEEWLSVDDPGGDGPGTTEIRARGGLGFAPATVDEIRAAENRLGRALPPSLRAFFLVSNGWRQAGEFVHRLAGAQELAWLKDTDDAHWAEAYAWCDELLLPVPTGEDEQSPQGEQNEQQQNEDHEGEEQRNEQGDGDGDGDGETGIATESVVISRSLRLSLEADAAVLFLDPKDVDENGEWAAYWLASWDGMPAERHTSFWELMNRLYASFHALRQPPGRTREHWEARTEEARHAALDGAVDEPLKEFEQAARFGRERADVLRFQMLVMLGDRHTVSLTRLLTCRIGDRNVLELPSMAAEFLPLLFDEERSYRRLPHAWSPRQYLEGHGPEPVRELLAAYAARSETPDFRISYGNPEFDAPVHELAARLAAEPAFRVPDPFDGPAPTFVDGGRYRPGESPYDRYRSAQEEKQRLYERAWPQLHRALTLWRPRSEHHLAPVVLLADPVLAPLITPERGREFLAMARR